MVCKLLLHLTAQLLSLQLLNYSFQTTRTSFLSAEVHAAHLVGPRRPVHSHVAAPCRALLGPSINLLLRGEMQNDKTWCLILLMARWKARWTALQRPKTRHFHLPSDSHKHISKDQVYHRLQLKILMSLPLLHCSQKSLLSQSFLKEVHPTRSAFILQVALNIWVPSELR